MAARKKPQDGEQVIREALKVSPDEMVTYILPLDPSAPDEDQCFVRSINGVFINIRRGVPVRIPKWVADYIDERERMRSESLRRAKDFILTEKNRVGKEL